MTEIYIHIDARMADYIRTHPYADTDTAVPAQPFIFLRIRPVDRPHST